MSASFLILGFVTRYIVFEVVSIAAFLLGSAFTFSSMESYIKARAASSAFASSLKSLAGLLSRDGFVGRLVFVPNREKNNVTAVIEKEAGGSTGTSHGLDTVSITPIGEDLVKMYDEELDGISGKDVDYLSLWLPKVIVDAYGLASKMKIRKIGENEFSFVFERPMFRDMCSEFIESGQRELICAKIGCPFSGSVPHAFSKALGKVVYFDGCRYDPLKRNATGTFRIGPSVGTSEEAGQAHESSN